MNIPHLERFHILLMSDEKARLESIASAESVTPTHFARWALREIMDQYTREHPYYADALRGSGKGTVANLI